MNRSIFWPVFSSVLLTALVVAGLFLLLQPSPEETVPSEELIARVYELEEESQLLREENQGLKDEIKMLTKEAEIPDEEIRRQPKPGWEEYFENGETTLEGEPVNDVREILGETPFKIRSTSANPVYNREIWVFLPFEEDPTGLYLYFKGNEVWCSRLDEFNGQYASDLLQEEEFWLN